MFCCTLMRISLEARAITTKWCIQANRWDQPRNDWVAWQLHGRHVVQWFRW